MISEDTTARDTVRVALVQSHWKETPEENLQAVLRLVDRISADTDLIVLPEFFLGAPWYFPGREYLKGRVDQTIPGPLTDKFRRIARERHAYIVCGTIVERENDLYYNTTVVIDWNGKIVGKARKIHRFSAELLSIEAGESQLLLSTPLGKIGVCVCSDFWIPEMPRMLALNGAEMIVVPGAAIRGNVGITRPCIQATSSFNVCHTVFAGLVGEARGSRGGRTVSISMAGCSTVSSPERILATLDEQESVLHATLDMEHLRELRTVDLSFRRSLYWCLHGRRPELYGDIMKPYVATSDLPALLAEYLD